VTSAAPSLPPAVARQRNVILVTLVGLAGAGWVVFLYQARRPMGASMPMAGMDGSGAGLRPDLTMGHSWPLFLAMWVAMMVAMMFPASVPMVTMYGRMRQRDPASIVLFTGSYIVLWFVFGVAAYLVGAAVESAASGSEWVAMNWGRAGGALIVLAGVYQLTPLKEVCLRHCRSPLAFVMSHWRDGRGGAVQMGLRHGAYCMGCCWLLFLILVPIGVMNVAAMAVIAVLVFIEKTTPWSRRFTQLGAVVLIGYGIAVIAHPALLPTVA
jgi:predicted metal-binding membrane protein